LRSEDGGSSSDVQSQDGPPRTVTFHASQLGDKLLAAGDADGARTWRRILKVVEQLQSSAPPEGGTAH